jgi:hypothetical protein
MSGWKRPPEWRSIPEHCVDGLKLYIERGIRPGGFLQAVLQNDLYLACSRADIVNSLALVAYTKFLHYYAPEACFGSPEAMRAWVAHHGLAGQKKVVEVS